MTPVPAPRDEVPAWTARLREVYARNCGVHDEALAREIVQALRDAGRAERDKAAKRLDEGINNGDSWFLADFLGRTRLGSLTPDEWKVANEILRMRAASLRSRPSGAGGG